MRACNENRNIEFRKNIGQLKVFKARQAKMCPIPALKTRGDQSEAEPCVQIICFIFAAAAERNNVPTLPGSCTFSRINVSTL